MSATPKHHERHVRQLHKRQHGQTSPAVTSSQKKQKLTANAVQTLQQRVAVTPPVKQQPQSAASDLLDLTSVDDPDRQIYQPLPTAQHLPSPYAQPASAGDNKQWLNSLLASLISKTLPSSSLVQSTIESKLSHRTLLLDNRSENVRTLTTAAGTVADSSDKLTAGRQCITSGQQRGLEDSKYSKQRKQLKLLSSRQKKALKLTQLPSKALYAAYLKVHELWQQYMHDLLTQASLDGQQSATPQKQSKHNQSNQQTPTTTPKSKQSPKQHQLKLDRLLTCDYTGCHMTVTQSVNPSNVGVTGIVMQETMQALKLVTKSNAIKTILKRGSVFTFDVQHLTTDNALRSFELYGSSICMRSSDRSVRKFKFKPVVQEVI